MIRTALVRGWLRPALYASALVGAAFVAPPSASAGWDDFEFGQRLTDRGYIDYARKVFEGIQNDEKRPQADRDRARYGMALLGKAEARNAVYAEKTPWAEARAKVRDALASIEDFVKKYPDDPAADEARFESANFRQWFVDRSAAVAEDKEQLAARGTTADEVLADAAKEAEAAIQTFQWLVTNAKKDVDRQLAKYGAAVMGYYRALSLAKCSAGQKQALANARKQLEEYAFDNDGRLDALYAQDFQGQAIQAEADCADTAKDRFAGYQNALRQFTGVATIDDQGEETRKVMALGYYHIGRLANRVAKTDELEPGADPAVNDADVRGLLQEAVRYLQELKSRAAAAHLDKLDLGLRAMVEWGLVEWRLERGTEATAILNRASEAAADAGFTGVVALANAALGRVASSGSGGGDPAVLFKVAEDLKSKGKWQEAIAAYQKVISSAATTPDSLRKYVYPAWLSIGNLYAAQKLPIAAAAAFDAIIDEARAGRVDAKSDDLAKRSVRDAMEAARRALNEIAVRSGDPTDKRRAQAFTDWMITAAATYAAEAGGGGMGALAFRRARELFVEAARARQENKPKADWQRAFEDSRAQFERVATDDKSEQQDEARVFLVRAAYELEKYDDAIKAAEAARAAWDTKAAKDRAAASPTIANTRPGFAAAVDYWEARAQQASGKAEAALKGLTAYGTKHGRAAGEYAGRALGLKTEILADLGRWPEAEASFEELVRQSPDFYAIPTILLKLGKHYQDETKTIQTKIDEINADLRTKRAARASLVRDEELLIERISGLNQTIAYHEQYFESLKQPGAAAPNEEEKKKHEKELKAELADRDAALAQLAAVRAKSAAGAKALDDQVAARAKLQLEQVPSLRRMTELYHRLDEALQRMDTTDPLPKPRRKPEAVADLASRYWRLARIDPTTKDDLENARDLYEVYFASPEVAGYPENHAGKRAHQRAAGEIWYRIADKTKDPEQARTAYQKALAYLLPSAARSPVNSKVVVRMLRGDIAILPYRDPVRGGQWQFPVRRVDTVAEFREVVKKLGPDDLPRYADEAKQADYLRALEQFKRTIAEMEDGELERTVRSLRNAGFDVTFYTSFGETGTEYLLALAHSFARSGIATDAPGAIGAARAVLDVPPKAEDDSPEWWEAKTILLETSVAMAERATTPEQAKSWGVEADRAMVATKKIYARIGGAERPQTLAEWKDLRARLVAAMQKHGLKAQSLDLDAMPKDVAPPTPAPTPPPAAVPTPAAPAGKEPK
jgi:hypothetical protein